MSRRSFFWIVCAGLTCIAAPAKLEAQVANESPKLASNSVYPRKWPSGPPRTSVPAWAQPGRIHFARWDGGPIETAKAMLSGWPGFNPPIPDYLYVMTNWYDLRTVQYLRDAGLNLAWVTFSNGFSIPTERRQREMLRDYIAQCHKHNIHIMAYQSLANMFWEDMYEHVPESAQWAAIGKDGKPKPYGAADYNKMGRITRHMADLSNPQWREYLKKRIDLAIEAGADGVMYDNAYEAHLVDTLAELMAFALSRKKDFLVMANFHGRHYTLNRLLNAITTEDGGEAGVFPLHAIGEDLLKRRRELTQPELAIPVEGGCLLNNIGRFRIFENLSEGWKPVMIESNLRQQGMRMTDVMSAERHQLVMAENMMFNISDEVFVEGRFAYGLWYGEPKIRQIWEAIGRYNRFFTEHEQYYVGANSVASLAIVLDNRSEGDWLLNALAGRRLLFHVLYEHELTPEKLKPYAAVALLTAAQVREEALQALREYVEAGGKVFAAPGTGRSDETGRSREHPPLSSEKRGKGEMVCWEKLPSADNMAAALRAAERRGPVEMRAPQGVLYNVTRQTEPDRLIIHLANYLSHPVEKLMLTVPGDYGRVALLTPDDPPPAPHVLRPTQRVMEIEVPRLKIYSLVVLTRGR